MDNFKVTLTEAQYDVLFEAIGIAEFALQGCSFDPSPELSAKIDSLKEHIYATGEREIVDGKREGL